MAGEKSVLYTSIDSDPNDADQNIDALQYIYRWNTNSSNVLTYSFLDSASDLSYSLSTGVSFTSGFTAAQEAFAERALEEIETFANLVFVEIGDDPGENDRDAVIRFGNVTGHHTAFAYLPNPWESGGDTFFGDPDFVNVGIGDWGYVTYWHEIGHTLGLSHGDNMVPERAGVEYSVMSYNSVPGQTYPYYTQSPGNYAQSFMMYDIATIQRKYGANFNHNTGNTTYKAVQRSANLISIGPMLQGLRKPVNDLSRGALVEDIVYTIAITAVQAAQADDAANEK